MCVCVHNVCVCACVCVHVFVCVSFVCVCVLDYSQVKRLSLRLARQILVTIVLSARTCMRMHPHIMHCTTIRTTKTTTTTTTKLFYSWQFGPLEYLQWYRKGEKICLKSPYNDKYSRLSSKPFFTVRPWKMAWASHFSRQAISAVTPAACNVLDRIATKFCTRVAPDIIYMTT